jgi:hypothetical protein
MSTTTVSRVDATHPVLAQLVDAATRSFTGSVEVSVKDSAARDLKVVVWFEDGAIYAVHADGWTPPDAAYVLHRTGQDFSGLDIPPFQAAYEAERAGRQLMTAADLDLPRRDWAYGLLASALTWSKPSISRNRKASTESNLITATNWQAVTADVAARVDGLESAWRVVCESLKAAGITPVSATRACGVLAVHIEGSRLFTGGESLDLAAGRRGLSRYAILEELARAILSGAAPSFAQAPPTDEQQLIPEHWEDPERAWGWVGDVPVAVQAHVPPEVVADAYVAQSEPVEPPELEAEVEESFEEPARFVVPDPSEYAEVALEPDAEPEPAPYAAAEPDPVPDAVAEPAAQGAEGGARELLESWLKSSVSGADATIRMSIVQRMVDSAHAEAAARHQDVARAQDELAAAVGDARSAASIVSNARAMLGEAHDALEDAEREVARVRAQFSGVMAAAAQAAGRAAATAAAARNEDAALQALRAQVASQEAVAASAGRAADQAAREQVSTQAEVDQSAAPALERVTDAAEVIRLTAVTPAQDELDEANRRSAAAAQVAAAAGRGVEINLAAAAQAQAIADSLNFGEPEAA